MSTVEDFSRELENKLTAVMSVTPAVKEKLKSRGKMLARDRLSHLCDPDPGSVLELSSLAADGLYDGRFPGAGLVTAIAKVCGIWCAVIINEGSTMGGTWTGLSCEKALRLQQIAMELGLPALYIVDSGGAFLHTQAESFPEKFGRIFSNEAKIKNSISAEAQIPAMCDEIVMCETNGTIYLAGPPLVKAATGELLDQMLVGGCQDGFREFMPSVGTVRFLKVLNKKNSRLRYNCLVVIHAKEVTNEDDRASAEFYRKLHLFKTPKVAIVTNKDFLGVGAKHFKAHKMLLPQSPTASCLDFTFRFQWPDVVNAFKDTALIRDDGVIDSRDTKLVVAQCAGICNQRFVSACM
ncbi:hypothetical protein Pmar_PMAR024362 [Perkinsus marinus ATCC 50983]|uniref:methylcrotonoyl-CoA carboxylase n=1 Tax=Perkinsus marinus (strain ATCC 50983 / TXsc) TaxID=423536 RepID=C5LMM4_PERM5|nr:hypothetical protein Pmar_PMAR024362 [Perkinsus marinus ATCC 50983]EER02041.1 hypothetical protein Pmar_PMAR024362 [Perkinsus marinus ATCC 50983]|eukprot:XP_002769323.1 hypothetical protein Pmar_PMAR024362 [Perkinsus marinus ATCC 50983]